MRGIAPYRKIAILVVSLCAALIIQVSYYASAAAEFDGIQAAMKNQAAEIEIKKAHILEIQRARAAAEETRELRDELRTRLVATPDLRSVVRKLELDLEKHGYPPPHYSPHRSGDNIVRTEAAQFRVEGFDLTFECRFRDLIDLVEAWERLPYGIRIEELSVAPSTEANLLVRLTVRLRKMLTRSDP